MKEGYKKTEIGVIPDDWEIKSIGELFEFKNGLNKEKEYFGKGTKIINYVDVYRNRYIDNSIVKGLVEVSEKEKQSFNVKKGDVFFTRTSETIEDIGMTSVLVEDIDDAVYSGFVLRARSKTEDLNLYYKKYCFSDYATRKEITRKSSCTTRALTSGTLLKDVLIKIPPLKEQEKIAEILSTVDGQIDDTEMLIDKCQELKKGLMQRLLTKGIGHTEFKKTEVGEIPVDWEVKKFKDLTEILRCGVASTPKYVDEGILFLSAQNVQEKGLSLHKYKYISKELHKKLTKNDKPQRGDILYSRVGANYGMAAVVDIDIEFSVYVSLTLIRMKKEHDSNFYKYVLNSQLCKKQADIGVFQGAGVPNLNVKIVEGFKMIVPPIEEQERIGKILLTVDEEIEAYKSKKIALEELKKGLMQKLLSGKIRII